MIGRDSRPGRASRLFIMTAPRLRSELLRTHLKGFTRLLHKVEGGDVRAVHRTRVASRRLRELVPVLQLESDDCARLLRDLRRATRGLGRIRELDVAGQLLEAVTADMGQSRSWVVAATAAVQQARHAAHARSMHKGKLGGDLRRLAKRLDRVAGNLERAGRRDGRRWRWALDARAVRRADRLTAAIRAAGPFYLPERLHAVRIALKKLRYALELKAEASGAPVRELSLLRRSQELLGALHDRQLLIERFREMQAELPDRRASRELDDLIATLEDECRTLHARFVRQRRRMLEICARLTPQGSHPSVAPPEPRLAVAR